MVARLTLRKPSLGTSSTAANGSETRFAAAPTLVVDNSFALDTVDPQRSFDPTSWIVDRAIYDTLFTFRGNDLPIRFGCSSAHRQAATPRRSRSGSGGTSTSPTARR